MIRFDRVSYAYPSQQQPVLRDLTLRVEEGELLLVVGPSGSGKSTLLRCLNGLVPHFYGGRWQGTLRVDGRDPVAAGPQGMSDRVGFVLQDPEAQFVVDTVEAELAFAMENFALPQPVMRKRVEEVLDQLNIAHLRERPISTLSGGEKQRIAIAAVLTLHPRVLVLDEPTSQLDPQAAEEVLIALRQLNEDLGLTVVLSEHRLERVVQYADRLLYLPGPGQAPLLGEPAGVLAQVPLTPPLVTLGKALGWEPLPLTIKAGRRFARSLLLRREGEGQEDRGPGTENSVVPQASPLLPSAPSASSSARQPSVAIRDLWYDYDGQSALNGVSLTVTPGEFVAIMGRNGSGKTTLLKQMVGLLKPDRGQVLLTPYPRFPLSAEQHSVTDHSPETQGSGSLDTRTASIDEIVRFVGYVPQDPNTLLFADTLAEELAFTRKGHGLPEGDDTSLLEALGLVEQVDRYPRDLSGGERQRAALAAVLVAQPQIILLDEPTRGLDYQQKRSLAGFLLGQKGTGRTVIMVTHDVELVGQCADRVVLMAEGDVVVDGPTQQVMTDSLVFATQVNKLFRDERFLTVGDVLEGCGGL
jgi:energy-coupling factor transport system ATP-binding protein